ncbi:hypothetical protein BU24DRAFT_408271 [Aaosphaeria arxii CBS 175.79]|uniref:Uncharacterized protein n=1 Tax=Aaosphaeria arxii CBS 175.79 TaxID=1450172 RepID=A0A6A5XZV7_9PLEO|nr:uncharacterized protein BU24DRAFT_408271 [Aaosphaeria arxii CBS 175.79]KAF2018347.1 hypothetical protein BU24DRAFT_408271 [Aaosphaeria arxii CBS 175.79]
MFVIGGGVWSIIMEAASNKIAMTKRDRNKDRDSGNTSFNIQRDGFSTTVNVTVNVQSIPNQTNHQTEPTSGNKANRKRKPHRLNKKARKALKLEKERQDAALQSDAAQVAGGWDSDNAFLADGQTHDPESSATRPFPDDRVDQGTTPSLGAQISYDTTPLPDDKVDQGATPPSSVPCPNNKVMLGEQANEGCVKPCKGPGDVAIATISGHHNSNIDLDNINPLLKYYTSPCKGLGDVAITADNNNPGNNNPGNYDPSNDIPSPDDYGTGTTSNPIKVKDTPIQRLEVHMLTTYRLEVQDLLHVRLTSGPTGDIYRSIPRILFNCDQIDPNWDAFRVPIGDSGRTTILTIPDILSLQPQGLLTIGILDFAIEFECASDADKGAVAIIMNSS